MSQQPDNFEPLNPVQVEHHLRELSNRIAKGVRYVSERLYEFDEKERLYKKAFAIAFTTSDGSVEDRKQHAVLATGDACEARDVAKASLDYAKDLVKSYRDEMSSYQTISAMVRAMYSTAGRGEGA